MSSSLLLQQYSASLVCRTRMICERECKWRYSCCFVECCFQDLSKTACSVLFYFPYNFFSKHLVRVPVVHLYNSTNMATAGNKSHFIFSERSVHTFPMCTLTLFSVDEILLPRYAYRSTNFRGFPFKEEMAVSCLKHMNSVLSAFM